MEEKLKLNLGLEDVYFVKQESFSVEEEELQQELRDQMWKHYREVADKMLQKKLEDERALQLEKEFLVQDNLRIKELEAELTHIDQIRMKLKTKVRLVSA